MKVLIPITITDAMFTACSVAEPAAGETAWVSAGTYAVGDKRIRTGVHKIFRCILAHTGRTALPEDDPSYWEDVDPTVKLAPFDTYVSTGMASNFALGIGNDGWTLTDTVGTQGTEFMGGTAPDARSCTCDDHHVPGK